MSYGVFACLMMLIFLKRRVHFKNFETKPQKAKGRALKTRENTLTNEANFYRKDLHASLFKFHIMDLPIRVPKNEERRHVLLNFLRNLWDVVGCRSQRFEIHS